MSPRPQIRRRAHARNLILGVVALLGVVMGAAATPGPPGSMILIGTGGISWEDITEADTPNLWSLLQDGASGALVVRSVEANTCPVDGWLGLSAGSRASAPRPGSGPAQSRPCPAIPDPVPGGEAATTPGTATGTATGATGTATGASATGATVPGWAAYVEAARGNRLDARLGTLGDTAAAGTVCIAAIGPGGAVGGATSKGWVDHATQWSPDRLMADLATCPITLVDVGAVRDPHDVPPGEEAPGSVEGQLTTIDTRVGEILRAGPNGADYILASLSDAGRTERLRVVLARGPSFGPGLLTSSATRQNGLVQAPDLTATLLARAGLAVPDTVTGQPLAVDAAPDNSERRALSRLQTLTDLDRASHEVHGLVEPFFWGFGLVQLLTFGFVWFRTRRRPTTHGETDRQVRDLTWARRVGVVAAGVPVSTFLANLLPWWRFPMPLVCVTAAVGLFVGIVSYAAFRFPWRRSVLGPMTLVSAVTALVLAVDVMTGSRLQISSLMGLQPVVGGRFYGMGNVTFGLFATAALLLVTALSSHLMRSGQRRLAAITVAVVGAGALVVDGAPWWGADGGGPPAMLPGLVFLVLVILGVRLTWRRAVLVAAGTIGAAVLVAVLDWLRPADSRSHLGRFVQTALDGQGIDVITRKLAQNRDLLLSNMPLNLLIPAFLVGSAWMLLRPAAWPGRSLAAACRHAPTLRPGLLALLSTLVLGFGLNDSGAAIPPVAATLAIPLVVSLGVTLRLRELRATLPTREGRRAARVAAAATTARAAAQRARRGSASPTPAGRRSDRHTAESPRSDS